MPLSDPAPRQPRHLRHIECRGYRRDDGLWDIEGHLTDTKSYAFDNAFRGRIRPGDPVHEMRLRLTVDRDLVIRSAEAATEAGPYRICSEAAPAMARLEGLRIGPGWRRRVSERVGGAKGCTHLVEMLQPLATVAIQTVLADRGEWDAADAAKRPAHLDSCHALRTDGEIVRKHYPRWYTGAGDADD